MMVTVNDMLIKILCLFLFCFPFLCSARDNITWNSSISDFQGETLVSAGGRFELGFFTPNGSLHSRSRRYVGIWTVWTSWRTSDDPGMGRFTFQQGHDGLNQYTIRKEKSIIYWKSKVSGDFIDSNEDEILAAIFSGGFTSENQDMRLVMDQSGKIQFYLNFWTNDTTSYLLDPWMLYWSEPKKQM
jgi:hypothetical protein